MKRIITVLFSAVLIAAAAAQERQVDPAQFYALRRENGPYLVCVANIRGDEAKEMAVQLCDELRRHYKLHAFVHSQSEEQRAQEQMRVEALKAKSHGAPVRRHRVIDEYVVLVGNYKSYAAARAGCDKIKKLPPPRSVEPSKVAVGKLQEKLSDKLDESKVKQVKSNPFAKCWPVRNPLLPSEHAGKPKFDVALKNLNEGEPYSLFQCRSPYTLQLFAFSGGSEIVRKNKASIFDSSKWTAGQGLEMAEENARKVAAEIRNKAPGVDAYVLHTYDASLVTVGGFSGPNDPNIAITQRSLKEIGYAATGLMEVPKR